jgi:hypothetical protein
MVGSISPARRRAPRDFLTRAVTVGGFIVVATIGTATAALAHHPEIAASAECGGVVHFTATAWQTSSDPARTNPTIGVSYSTNSGGSFVSLQQLAAYHFGSDNGYAFSDTVDLTALTGSLPSSVVIKATALASWGNGAGGGSSRQTGVLTITGCAAKPGATISGVDCSSGGTVAIKLNNDGDEPAEFTVSGPGSSTVVSVAGHDTKSLTKTVIEDGDATYTVAATGMDTVSKTVHRDCTQPAPTVAFADNSERCSIDVTFGNTLGTQDAVFGVTDTAGNTAEVTVAAGESTTRNHTIEPGTSDTVTVTSPGMETATHTLACAAVVEPPVVEPPVVEPPVVEPPVVEPPVDNPPTEQPPVVEPPVVEPPVDNPPTEQPPVETPVSTPVVNPPKSPGSAVLGTTTTKVHHPVTSVGSANAQRQLPFTGSDTAELLIAGLLALASGLALTAAGRRRGDFG